MVAGPGLPAGRSRTRASHRSSLARRTARTDPSRFLGFARGDLRRAVRRAVQIGLPCLLLGSACAPTAVARQTRHAEFALAAAEASSAEQHALYELVLARLYLEKAREESTQAHYALARELLASAERNAVLARARSLSQLSQVASAAKPSAAKPSTATPRGAR